MQDKSQISVWKKIEELRLASERDKIQTQNMDSQKAMLQKSLRLIKSRTQETVENRAKLGKLKTQLREAEDDLVKALAVKTRKEAKRMAIMDSISVAKARTEDLRRILQDQKARKDEYAAVVSQQSLALTISEKKSHEIRERREEIEEAFSWYNRVLGFRIECGRGIKFIFTNINFSNPSEQCSFTIHHANDTYTLLDCNPHLNDTEELVYELNKTNGLFEFVRIMRKKFQEAAASGLALPHFTHFRQESSMICVSAPVSSVSSDSKSESPDKPNELAEAIRCLKKVNLGRPSKEANLGRTSKEAIGSPGSASSFG